MGMRYLVTGGAGFIGSRLVRELVSAGNEILVVDDLSSGRISNLGEVADRISLVQSDLRQWLCSDGARLAEYDGVFHLAANAYIPPSVENPRFDFESNLLASFDLLEVLRKFAPKSHLVFASSGGVYGNPLTLPIRETDPTVPISPYGVSKLAADRYLSVYADIYGLNAANLRFFSVYGPNQRKQVIYDLFRKVQTRTGVLEVLGDGSQVRDFIYVDDLVRALVLLMGQVGTFNVASGDSFSLSDVARLVVDVSGIDSEIRFTGSIRKGDAERWSVDTEKIQSLGFQAQVPLRDGMRAVWEWLEQNQEKRECE